MPEVSSLEIHNFRLNSSSQSPVFLFIYLFLVACTENELQTFFFFNLDNFLKENHLRFLFLL